MNRLNGQDRSSVEFRTVDTALVTLPEPAISAQPDGPEFRARTLAYLEAGEGHRAYQWAKSWITSGGATHPDPWLVYVASSLLDGKPRNAVHSIDLALGRWLPGAQDRAAFRWLRGCIVRTKLKDPKTALLDLLRAAQSVPDWACSHPDAYVAECQEEAHKSRKKVASVNGAWAYSEPPNMPSLRDHAYEPRADGDPPSRRLIAILVGLGLDARPRRCSSMAGLIMVC